VGDLEGEILELGAGTGLNLPHYRRAARVVALEPDPGMAGRLRERAASATVPVEVVEGRAEELPFPDASFDHVVSALVLCSVTDVERTLAELRRVLRPGGSLAVVEHVRGEGGVGRWQDRLTPLQRRISDGCHLNRRTGPALAAAGFDVSDLVRFDLPGALALLRPGLYGRAIRISS
jgi:SAM-dependent methyltransferase